MTIPTAALLGSTGGGGGTGTVDSVTGTAPIVVDNTDPANPVVSLASGVGTLKARFATTANDTLSGLAARDGVTPVAGDIAFVNFQTAPAANGLYVAAAGAWARYSGFDTAGEMIAGVLVSVTEGTLYAGSLWTFATTGAITVGVTALAFDLIGPTFGNDARTLIANSAGTLVQALRMLTTLTTNTAGAEDSQTEFYEKVSGVDTVGLTVRGTSLLLPNALIFASDLNTFIFHSGADNFGIWVGGTNILAFTAAGITLSGAASANLLWGAGGAGVTFASGTGQTSVLPDAAQGNVQLGIAGLTNASTHGFPMMPVFAGAPTGVVTVPAGMAAYALNSTNGHIYTSTGGGTWVDSSV